MSYGDSVETTVWYLQHQGRPLTLCLVTEVGVTSFFPPVLRVVRGHMDAAAAAAAPGLEHVWEEDDSALAAFVSGWIAL